MNTLQVITESVHVRPDRGRIRKLTAAVIVRWRGVAIVVPSGFEFDGASVPFFLWWWVSPWRQWVVLAACVHDYLYRTRMLPRDEADHVFKLLLYHKARQTKSRWLRYRRIMKARVMYAAVRWRGEPYYHRNL